MITRSHSATPAGHADHPAEHRSRGSLLREIYSLFIILIWSVPLILCAGMEKLVNARRLVLGVALALGGMCAAWAGESRGEDAGTASRAAGAPVLKVAYFVPSDRTPLDDHPARLERVLSEVQAFYKKGMEEAGYGPRTFPLDRDEGGRLRIHVVRGALPMRSYGRNDSEKVRREVRQALRPRGVDLDRETIVIFQLLLEWKDGATTEVGPYVGGGGPSGGTAWVYDDRLLDPQLLGSKEPGGYYGSPCSIGEFNSHYIGGVAHELGHALGLPHDCERKAERAAKGQSLMGGGNHTYGREKRGEGPGTFLSAASALALARHPLFTGTRFVPAASECRLLDLRADFQGGRLILSGRAEGAPPAYGAIAYDDDPRIPADYDAVGWTAPVGKDGGFRVEIGELKRGPFDLRLAIYGENAACRVFSFSSVVDEAGKPALSPFLEGPLFAEAYLAVSRGDVRAVKAAAARIAEHCKDDPAALRKAALLPKLLEDRRTMAPADVPAGRTSVSVSELSLERGVVGWGPALRDRVYVESAGTPFLEVGDELFDSGLFAHAPARHALRLGGKWKRFRSGYGLQDGHEGSVAFAVRADGKEIHRSPLVRDHRVHRVDVDVSGADSLELIVEDGGDGANSDWGVWVSPVLER